MRYLFSVIVVSINLLNKEEVLEKYPHQLSGGMLQRIMIGIAMALQPELLIADEPTTAIDAITQYEILEEFIRIKKNKNTAMLFITHDLGAISKVADRILVMNSGRIVMLVIVSAQSLIKSSDFFVSFHGLRSFLRF